MSEFRSVLFGPKLNAKMAEQSRVRGWRGGEPNDEERRACSSDSCCYSCLKWRFHRNYEYGDGFRDGLNDRLSLWGMLSQLYELD